MKNLKKLDRRSLKNVNGGSYTCNLNCEIHETCGLGCNGELICVPRGMYIPDNC
ncbi:bacteriocin-like protein [Chryseobacterium sp.]|uniref:bacteriocin-like protein n=1 Tax=unclassified Chryseobacterium TaxID=2593645 RepID=UPI003918300D